MTIELTSLVLKHERRAQLLFSEPVAFGAYSPTLYSVTNMDGGAASPSVVAVYVVPNSPHAVELALGADLTPGGRYRFAAPGVPAAGGGSTASPSTLDAAFGRTTAATPKGSSGSSELEALLYGVDIVWENGDFAEAPSGDLATVGGVANLEAALWRRLLSNGLPWATGYGLGARQAVDGLSSGLLGLRGRAEAQMREDDRVRSATARVERDASAREGYVFVDAQPIGVGDVGTMKVPVGLGG